MSNQIVLLSGSPRKGGNTDRLVEAFMEGAAEAEKSVNLFRVADMEIKGCLGCGHCHNHNGVCVQKDDMTVILDVLREAEALVLASPVYFFGVTAQLKLAIDRTYALLRQKTQREKVALLMTCGNGDASVAEGAILMLEKMCWISHYENAGVIVATGIHGMDDIIGRPELEQAKELGQKI